MTEITKKEEKGLATLGVRGLMNFDSTDLPIPRVRVVQPTSQKIELADGKDAAVGTFYFGVAQKAKEKVEMIVLSAKKDEVQWEGDEAPQMIYRLMAIERGKIDPFVMSITGTSRWQWRNILGLLVSMKAESVWEYPITMTTEKREGEKGKWYEIQFKLGKKLEKDERKRTNLLLVDLLCQRLKKLS